MFFFEAIFHILEQKRLIPNIGLFELNTMTSSLKKDRNMIKMEEKISLIKLEMKNQHFENMEILETLEKLNDSIDFLKLLVPSSSNGSSYDNYCCSSPSKPPPINHRLETKFNGPKKTLYDNLEKKPQNLQRTNIPINTKYLTLKRNCTLVNHQSKQACEEYYRIQERSKSKAKLPDARPVSSTHNKAKLANIESGISGKPPKIRTPNLVNKNFSTFSTTNSKVYHSNNTFSSSRFCTKNVDLVRLKLSGKIPEYSSSINESSHLKFDERKLLNQIYYI